MCEVQRLIRDHLKRNGLQKDGNFAWEIRKSDFGGRGIFATRDIRAGEVVFVDHPLVLGPRTCPGDVCVACYKDEQLQWCSKDCGLPVCSSECEESRIHRDECAKINGWKNAGSEISENLIWYLTPIRALFMNATAMELMKNLAAHLDAEHGSEVTVLKQEMKLDIPEDEEVVMRMACAVLDANAFEVLVYEDVPTLRGLYPLSSLMNHRCTPNTMHVFDSEQFMVIRATVDIKKGEELFTTYCKLIWGTLSRRYHLQRTKNFDCGCQRCIDPTEFGTYMTSVLCLKCHGRLTSIDPLIRKSEWKCETCFESVPETTVGFINAALAKHLATLRNRDLEDIVKYYESRIAKIVPESNEIFMDLKYRMIWMLGYKIGYLFSELSEELLRVKEKFCYDILEVLEKLGVGACKMRGLLLFEVVRCNEEKKRRGLPEENNNEEPVFEVEKIMEEISKIFLYNLAAPKEIKEYWERHNIDNNWRNVL